MTLNPRFSAQLISGSAKNVSICQKSVTELAEKIYEDMTAENFSLSLWKETDLHPNIANEDAIDWIFVVDSLNFSFWEDKLAFYVPYNGRRWTGYFALCAAINRALDDGIPITSADFCKNISVDLLKKVFRVESENNLGSVEFPLMEERLNVLRENSAILVEKYGGSFINCIRMSEQSCEKLLAIIVNDFPSFRDEGHYENQRVSFYKRAQIMVADIWACFEDKALGHFKDIDKLTVFADYRVPQVLAYYGVLQYSDQLKARIQARQLMNNGERDEMEIRALTIHACELIKEELAERFREENLTMPQKLNSVTLDFYLWNLRRKIANEIQVKIDFHRTRSIFY